MKKWFVFAACGLALSGCGSKAAEAPPSQTPAEAPAAEPGVTRWNGSRVSLWVPKEMRRPTRQTFFKMDEPLAVIAITEMTSPNGSAEEMLAGAKESVGGEAEPATRGNAKGFLAQSKSEETGMDRQVLALGEGAAATVIVAQYQQTALPVVTRILESVKLDGAVKLDPLALYGIRVADMAGFEVWDVASQPIILADKGARPPLAAGVATFALMTMPYPKAEVSDDELGQMLGSVVGKMQPDMQKAKMDDFAIAGTQAFVVSAPGVKDGKPIGIYAFIVRRPDSALVGFGDVALPELDKTQPRFERLVKSITLDDSILSP